MGKEIKMLGRGGGKNIKLGWGIYTPGLLSPAVPHSGDEAHTLIVHISATGDPRYEMHLKTNY